MEHMKNNKSKNTSVKEYIESFEGDVRMRMEKLREIILSCSPERVCESFSVNV